MEQENVMHPELNTESISHSAPELMHEDLIHEVNTVQPENPITLGSKINELEIPKKSEGFVTPEAINEITTRIATMGLASQEAIIKASNGASELGPVSAEKINEVANAAIEQSAESIMLQGKLKGVALHAEDVQLNYKKVEQNATQEVKDVFNPVIGRANRGIVAVRNSATRGRDKFINTLT